MERILKTSAGLKIGRPQTGFEKWRSSILNAELVSFEEYIDRCLDDIRLKGGKIEYGNKNNDVFVPVNNGELYTIIKVTFSGQPSKFRSLRSFNEDWQKYVAEFKAAKIRASGVKPDNIDSFLEGVFL
jgi:hypothetical protein